MRYYLNTAPRWVLCLIYGLPFGAIMAIGILADNSSGALEIIAFGLVAGLVFGAGMTFVTGKQRGEVRTVIGEIPADRVRGVYRAAWTGPVPSEPELHAAALRLARYDSAQAWRGLILPVPFALLFAAAAIFKDENRLPYAGVAIFLLAGIVYQVITTIRLKRRVELLAEADEPA
jgi:hypothetical protein